MLALQALNAADSARTALQAIGVDYERALARTPQLATLEQTDLRASLTFLSRYMSTDRLCPFVAQHPEALLWASSGIERLLRNELGASDAELRQLLLVAAPFLLSPGAAPRARDVVRFLRAELKLSAPETLAAVRAFPRLLTLHVHAPSGAATGGDGAGSGLSERVRFLAAAADVDVSSVGRAVCKHPQLLGLDLHSSLRPKAAYLRSVGIDMARLLLVHPQAFSLSTASNLAPKVAYWQRVGVPDVGAMLSVQPTLASLSLEANIAPKTEYLQALGIPGLGAALQAYPQVYTLSLRSNIIPTVRFLELCGYNIRAELRLRHLAASLARRIVPRHELWRRHRAKLGGWRPSVADLCVLAAAGFCSRVGAEPSELVEVEAAVGPIVRELSLIDPHALASAFGADDPVPPAELCAAEAAQRSPPRRRRRRRAPDAASGDVPGEGTTCAAPDDGGSDAVGIT